MTMLSARLSRALRHGRANAASPSRAGLLASLLRKRAAAHASGDAALEELLRDQIRWALPLQKDEEETAG